MKIETQCLHEGYTPENGQPNVLPICQSTTFFYDSTERIGDLFDLKTDGHMYSRISNPTVDCVERKIAALEGGVGALCTTSGQAATLIAVLNLLRAGDHIVASASIYGGTFNLLGVTLARFGIQSTFVDQEAGEAEIGNAFRPSTKALMGETIANPALAVLDIEKFARIAHAHGVPLIVDNTFATPVLCRPFAHGADIVIHSTTKYMEGHAVQVGGAIVDGGRFDWGNGKFPDLTEPDASYHGVVYTRQFGAGAYIAKARHQLMRDIGAYPSAQAAFLLELGLQTLPVRMERHCRNAEKVAAFLSSHRDVEGVRYPGLPGDPFHARAKKYLPLGTSGVITFSVRGGREKAVRFMNGLKIAANVVNVAEIRTCVLHPASATHRQMNDAQLAAAGITPGLIRFSVGLENADDLIADLDQALEKARRPA
jgi:O-acetylhomoserine (thiol)-lyase